MKRFTATEKWSKTWFQELSTKHKLLWYFLYENCDCAGVWDTNYRMATFLIGEKITELDMKVFEGRIFKLPNGKFWLTGFLSFQYGDLSETCPAHKPVFRALASHCLTPEYRQSILSNTLSGSLSNRLQEEEEEEDKEKEEEKKKGESEGKTPLPPVKSDAEEIIEFLNRKTNRRFQCSEANRESINARMKEPEVTLAGVLQMIDRQCKKWVGTKYEEFLTPTTLFRPTKFGNYYAAKDAPIILQDSLPTRAESNQRVEGLQLKPFQL